VVKNPHTGAHGHTDHREMENDPIFDPTDSIASCIWQQSTGFLRLTRPSEGKGTHIILLLVGIETSNQYIRRDVEHAGEQ
jgi:hypothetical protein